MKYLKRYRIFENIDEILQNIDDIFIEIKDKNPNVRISASEIVRGPNNLTVCISSQKLINTNDISDELLRLNDYLDIEGYEFYTFNYGDHGELKYASVEFSKEVIRSRRRSKDILELLFKIKPTTHLELFFR